MNLFLISLTVPEAVKELCDKHVVRMILETAQILYSVWHVRCHLPNDLSLKEIAAYKKTHVNHPICVWARYCKCHYEWACMYGLLLCQEYTFRYGKTHKSEYHLKRLYNWGYPEKIYEEPIIKKKTKEWIYATDGIPPYFEYFPLCMDEEMYVESENGYNALLSYRKYYQSKQHNFKMSWSKSRIPDWFHMQK